MSVPGPRLKRSAPESHRKNVPGLYRCPRCNELLSSPPENYTCPKAPKK